MPTREDITRRMEEMGGKEIPYFEIRNGMHVAILQHSHLNVSGFYLDDKVRISEVPSMTSREFGNPSKPRMKIKFKNIKRRYFAEAQEFLNGEGRLSNLKTTKRNVGFFVFSADDPVFYARPNSKLQNLLKRII